MGYVLVDGRPRAQGVETRPDAPRARRSHAAAPGRAHPPGPVAGERPGRRDPDHAARGLASPARAAQGGHRARGPARTRGAVPALRRSARDRGGARLLRGDEPRVGARARGVQGLRRGRVRGRGMTIRKSIHVKRPVETAFRRFTADIGKWWPLQEGFSFDRARAHEIFLEPRVGGRFFERYRDGDEQDVGRVTTWEPPARVVFTWKQPSWEAETQ